MKKKTIFTHILAALICSAMLASSFAGCQAEAKTDSTVIVEETKTEKEEEEEEEIVRTLFSKPLLEAYEDAFQTHVTATTESVLQAMKDKTLVDNTAEVIPVFTKETLEEELADIEERANTLEMRLARDNEEFYCRWRDDQILKLSAELQIRYNDWLAEQKAAEEAAKKAAEEEAAKKAAEEAAQQQQPSGGGTSGSTGSTGGGGSSGGGSDYTPPAPQPDPEPEYTPPQPAPEPEPPAQDYTPPAQDNSGGGWTGGDDAILGGFVDSNTGDVIVGG